MRAPWIIAYRFSAKIGRGPLTMHWHAGDEAIPHPEIALTGVIALRNLGQTLQWDGPNMRFKSSDSATTLLTPSFREGWSL